MTASIQVSLATVVEAGTLAKKYNLAAQKQGKARNAAVLEQAVGFIDSVSDRLSKGWEIVWGCAWVDEEPFLDKKSARNLGVHKRFKDPLEQRLYDAAEKATTALSVDDATAAKVQKIKKAFNLKSDAEAARMAMSAYSRMKDHLWRGNGLSFKKGGVHAPFDTKPYLGR